jgi:hypothetical protein
MNVEIGTEAAQFPEKEYINGISPKFVSLRPERKSFMSYVRNDFIVTQKILETKWISSRKEVGQKIRQI